jgi:hypothetical protein
MKPRRPGPDTTPGKARDRVELMTKAAIGLLPASSAPPDTLFGFPMHSTLPSPEEHAPDVRRAPGTRHVVTLPRSAAAS